MLVGGCVRDHLLGLTPKDFDVEVFGLGEEDLVRALRSTGRVNLVGRAFGVFKVSRRGTDEVDVSLPRRDSQSGTRHNDIVVEGDPTLSFFEASRRRDLTINAISIDPLTGEQIDPAGGLADVAARRLQAVDATTFLEDPLRALRVVQFTARLDFRPSDALLDLCREADLAELPAERIQTEWLKLLLKAPRPSLGLMVARDTQQLSRLFPERTDHPDLDQAVDALCLNIPPARLRARHLSMLLTAWLAHSSPTAVSATLDRLGLHSFEGFKVRTTVELATSHLSAAPTSDADLRHLSVHTELETTLTAGAAVFGDQGRGQALTRAAELGILHNKPDALLLGRDLLALGVPAGRGMGELLKQVYTAQLDGSVASAEQALAEAKRLIHA